MFWSKKNDQSSILDSAENWTVLGPENVEIVGDLCHRDFDSEALALQQGWAKEKASHLASLLKYKYGTKAVPIMSKAGDVYAISVPCDERDYDLQSAYNLFEIIGMDVYGESIALWIEYIRGFEVGVQESDPEYEFKFEERLVLPGPAVELSREESKLGLALEKAEHIVTISRHRYGVDVITSLADGKFVFRMFGPIRTPAESSACTADLLLHANAEEFARFHRVLYVMNYVDGVLT